MEQRHDEDIQQFAARYQNAATHFTQPEMMTVTHFCNKIKPEYRQAVRMQMPRTMEQAVDAALYEEGRQDMQKMEDAKQEEAA